MPNNSATTRPVAESLDGTRTSHRWQEQPGSWDTVNTRAIYPAANDWGIPDRFEAMWTKPERPLTRLRRTGLALTPDFSLWLEMPRAVQLWQVYRSRWCGAWWLSHGINVIPTVSWAGPGSHEYAFAGIAAASVVAVSSVGVIRNRDALRLFAAGVDAMLRTVSPAKIVCYGAWPWNAIRNPDLVDVVAEYPTRWEGRRGRQGS